ncbi:MAG TPA: hypothetical protein VFZ66_05000 [Herpetosiphonaceae bacterium]
MTTTGPIKLLVAMLYALQPASRSLISPATDRLRFLPLHVAALVMLAACGLPGAPTQRAVEITQPVQAAQANVQPTQTSETQGAAAAGMITFTGTTSHHADDADGNGLFEYLRVDVEVSATQASTVGVTALLTTANGDLIAMGSLTPDANRSAPLTIADLTPGIQKLTIYFSGADIRALGAADPYTVSLELTDLAGSTIASTSFPVPAGEPQTFQGALVEIESIADQGISTDATPGFEQLRVTLNVKLLAATTVSLDGQVFGGDTALGTAEKTVQLAAGSQRLDLDFAGEALARSRIDGPYTVYLTVRDATYTSSTEHTTAAYRADDFQRR